MEETHRIPKVWIPDDTEVWKLATLVRTDEEKEEVCVNDDGQEKIYSSNKTHPLDPTHLEDLDDLCSMNNLHEAPLLSILHRRFQRDIIYTTTGNVLISINPYKTIPGLYDKPLSYLSRIEEFDVKSLDDKSAPHLFKVANSAFNCVTKGDANQSVIVSGESGAGKTEASKYVMQFLIAANEGMASSNIGDDIRDVLLDSNAVFESFGNSKTVRNDNSSRFGKYIKLQYNSENCLVSAFTETFLLEKSRLSYLGRGERNYHVFYQMIRGLGSGSDASEKESLCLSSVDNFAILTAGDCTVLSSEQEDIVEFNTLHRALATMGTTAEEMRCLWAILACILHLGNLECVEGDGSGTEEPETPQGVSLRSPCMPLGRLAELLGFTEELFKDTLTHHIVRIASKRRTSTIRKPLKAEDVRHNILGLNKWLYSAVFSWLVRKINHAHLSVAKRQESGTVTADNRPPGRRHSKAAMSEMEELKNITAVKFIGILDIFGFEILGRNSFEQLCINFANERLQQQFNEHVFVNEQLEYEREGLNWSTITYQDNQHVIDLIAKKPSGLLPILEEYGMLNRTPDDRALLSSFNQAHDTKGGKKLTGNTTEVSPSSAYARPRFGDQAFIVKHFAGNVEYEIDGFLMKNNDSLQDDIMELLLTSNNKFLLNMAYLFPVEGEPGYLPECDGGVPAIKAPPLGSDGRRATVVSGSSRRGSSPPPSSTNKKMAASSTVSLIFRSQLDELMQTLRSTNPHYIKCIKPNPNKAAMQFDAKLVMQQLRYSGALEVVRIRREGFPQRCSFKDFYDPYHLLSHNRGYRARALRRSTRETLARQSSLNNSSTNPPPVPVDSESTASGGDNSSELVTDEASAMLIAFAVDMEWKGRAEDMADTFLPADQFQVGNAKLFLREGALKLMNLAMKKFLDDSAAKIQSLARMKSAYRSFERRRNDIIVAQTVARMFIARRKYHVKLRAVRAIQWFAIGKRLRREYLQRLKAGQLICHTLSGYRDRIRYLALLRRRLTSSIRIQCWYRSIVARRSAKMRKAAAVAIQSAARRKICRRRYLSCLAKTVLMQSAVRRHAARCNYSKSIAACKQIQSTCRMMIAVNKFRLAKISAVTIQNAVRKRYAVKNYNVTLRSCVLIQSICRMLQQSRRYRRAQKFAVKIQSTVRRRQAVERYNFTLRSCVLIQSVCRMLAEKERMRVAKESAIKIQSAMRGKTARTQYTKVYRGCVLVQSLCRMMICCNKLRIQRNSAVKLQASVRKQQMLRRFKKAKACCVLLQSVGRKHMCSRQYRKSRSSATLIQKIARGRQASRAYQKKLRQYIMVQAMVRRWISLRQYRICKESVKRIQTAARRYICMRHYAHDRAMVLTSQAFARRHIARKNYLSVLVKIIRIQSKWRMYAERKRFLRAQSMSTRISCHIRAALVRWEYSNKRKSCLRIQKAIKSFLRNIYLRKSLDYLYTLCATCQESDMEQLLLPPPPVMAYGLTKGPQRDNSGPYGSYTSVHLRDFLSIRRRSMNFASPLHVALYHGNMAAVRALRPGPADILCKDSKGNSSVHYVAMHPTVDAMDYLADALQVRYTYSALLQCGILGDEGSHAAVSAAKVSQGKLWGRRGSFLVGDDDSDDEGTSGRALDEGLTAALSGECIKQGWLKKRRVGGRWQKRWTVLSPTGLAYYKRKGDDVPKGIVPIEGSVVSKQQGSDPVFEIVNERLVVKKKHEGKNPAMEFMAENEKDLQQWLLPLRALAGTGTGERGFRPGADEFDMDFIPINYVNSDLRVTWLNETNDDGETPLHVLARFKNRGNDGSPLVPTARILQLAMWFIVNGCDINAQNNCGQTALHVAVRYGNIELARCLVMKGADSTIKNHDGNTVLDLSTPEFVKEISAGTSGSVSLVHSAKTQNRLRGYSYLTIQFQKHSQTSTEHRQDFESLRYPFLSIAVYNSQRKLIENIQNMPIPGVRRSSYVWWGCAWHMQTPLENINENCYVVIELKNASSWSQILLPSAAPAQQSSSSGGFSSFFGGGSSSSESVYATTSQGTSIAWYIHPLDLTKLNSTSQTFELFQSPVLLPPGPKDPPHPDSSYRSDCSFLETNFLISKRGKDVDLRDYRSQPSWVHHHLPKPGEDVRTASVIRQSAEPPPNRERPPVNISKLMGVTAEEEEHEGDTFSEENINAMGIKELKSHLESFGVDYSSFVEKSELRQALKNAVGGLKKKLL